LPHLRTEDFSARAHRDRCPGRTVAGVP